MTHDDCRELLALQALDALDPDDRPAVASHVAACSRCARELDVLRETAGSLALLTPPHAPPSDAVARLFAAIDARDARPARPARRRLPLAVAAGIVVVMAASEWRLLGQLANARRQLASMREVGRFVTSPNVSIVPLWGPDGAHGWHAKVAYDRSTGRFVFLSSRLPSPPAGKGYRLWVISERISPAGTVSAEAPVGVLPVPRRGEAFFLAVSIEPAAEDDTPDEPLVLMSHALLDAE